MLCQTIRFEARECLTAQFSHLGHRNEADILDCDISYAENGVARTRELSAQSLLALCHISYRLEGVWSSCYALAARFVGRCEGYFIFRKCQV